MGSKIKIAGIQRGGPGFVAVTGLYQLAGVNRPDLPILFLVPSGGAGV